MTAAAVTAPEPATTGKAFLEHMLVEASPAEGLPSAEVWSAYEAWCEDLGLVPEPKRSFLLEVSARCGSSDVRRVDGTAVRVYPGVALRTNEPTVDSLLPPGLPAWERLVWGVPEYRAELLRRYRKTASVLSPVAAAAWLAEVRDVYAAEFAEDMIKTLRSR